MENRFILTEATRRALEILDTCGIEYRYDIKSGSYSFAYYGETVCLETQTGEWGICLSTEFHFWQANSYDLMKCLQEIVDRVGEGFVAKEIAQGTGRVAKEWLVDCEQDLSEDTMIEMLDELYQAWHSISFNLYLTRERDEEECLYLGE